MANVIILFERSGIVREEFRKRGHDAWSADIEPAEDGSKHHIQVDIIEAATRSFAGGILNWPRWALAIAHPACTDLAVSGALRFKEKIADGRQQASIDNFMAVTRIPVKRKVVENPVSIMSRLWRKPDQIIHPNQFGHDASKKTCIWLEGLPKLIIDPALYVQPRYVCYRCAKAVMPTWGLKNPGNCNNCGSYSSGRLPRWANQTNSGQNRLTPSEHRAMDRARTYPGIAAAFAKNWGWLIR